jgi:hypothetical protein
MICWHLKKRITLGVLPETVRAVIEGAVYFIVTDADV